MKRIFLLVLCLAIAGNVIGREIASITIEPEQDLVSVYINNEFYGIASGPSTIADLRPGNYLVTITKLNYKKYEEMVELKEGESKVLKVKLISNTEQGQTAAIPGGSALSGQQIQKLREAGDALRTYSSLYYIGFGFEIVAIGAASIATFNTSMDPGMRGIILLGGGVFSITGFILQLIAPSKVHTAGKILSEIACIDNNTTLANLDFKLDQHNYDLNYTYRF